MKEIAKSQRLLTDHESRKKPPNSQNTKVFNHVLTEQVHKIRQDFSTLSFYLFSLRYINGFLGGDYKA